MLPFQDPPSSCTFFWDWVKHSRKTRCKNNGEAVCGGTLNTVLLLRRHPWVLRQEQEGYVQICSSAHPRYSNVVLTVAEADRADQFIGLPILAAGHQVGALQSSERQLQVRDPQYCW